MALCWARIKGCFSVCLAWIRGFFSVFWAWIRTTTNGEENRPVGERKPMLSESNKKFPELVGKQWYRGDISNDDADRYLDEIDSQGHDGSYIVYDNPVTTGQYILLVYYRSDKLRWKIQLVKGMYILGEDGSEVNRYKTVKELIKAHRGVLGKPIETEEGGIVTLRKM